jgi:hypothetical protein
LAEKLRLVNQLPLRGVHFSLKRAAKYSLYLAAVLLMEYASVISFVSEGLFDPSPLKISLGEGLPQIYLSIFLHLIPLNVAIIIFFNIIYFEKYLSAMSRKRIMQVKAGGKTLLETFQSAYGGSLSIILLFAFSSLITFILICPSILHKFAVNLYWSNILFKGVIGWTRQINSLLISILSSLAISFRNNLWGLIKPFSEMLLNLEVSWKYLIYQNIVAWVPSIIVLAYVKLGERRKKTA